MRTITCLFVLVAFGYKADAQFIKIGPAVGANLQKINGKSFKDGYQLGYYAGIFAELKLGEKWQLQPELLWSETQLRTSSDFRDIYGDILSADSLRKIKLSQICIPVLLNFKVANVLALQLGPQFSINRDKNNTILKDAGNAFTNGDFAMVGGVKLILSRIRVSARYAIGLSNINDIDDQDQWKSQTIQLGVGFVF